MTSAEIVKMLLAVAASYLLGSVNFSIIVTRLIAHKDIRQDGSGNAGATNVLRSVGKVPAFLTVLGDMGKVILAIYFTRLIIGAEFFNAFPAFWNYLTGLFAVLGHMYPLYFKFKGGKGVASCAGMILILDWRIFLIEFVIFSLVILVSKMVSLGSLTMAVTYPALTWFFYVKAPLTGAITSLEFIRPYERILVTLFALIFSLLVIWKHRENVKRIFKGTEHKIGGKKKKSTGG